MNSDSDFPDSGLLHAYCLLDNGNAEAITSPQALRQNVNSGFRWVHLLSDHIESKRWMKDLAIDESIIELLIAEDTRPRTLSIGGGILVNLRGVNTNPGADRDDMVSIRI